MHDFLTRHRRRRTVRRRRSPNSSTPTPRFRKSTSPTSCRNGPRPSGERLGLAGTYPSFEAMLDGGLDAVAIFTQRWTHGPLVAAGAPGRQARLLGGADGHHARTRSREIIERVGRPGLTYMMGETSYYNPATVYARKRRSPRARSAGSSTPRATTSTTWTSASTTPTSTAAGRTGRRTASYPPMLYPTHSIGGVLGAIGRATPSASAASASPTSAATASSTRTSACSATTSPTPPRCSSSPAAGPCASTRCAASATPRTCARAASGSSAPRPASSSWPRSACGRTRRP